ncbi:uncharacterized protein EI90DRAFT_3022688 [Cantharellus anzutake]|uniref:uncharacterized protein n=1 Tax=Cantharellus anzutake TaxID=1750568 RepID=UPI0019076830|nr:uncharacterized protein EI90DRAFT_3022688 [Cantharellus anzutake]KAF8313324.1 hypothetical protein EI90DRAFT_3022688 [Cantharellus anzutake]
MVSGQVIYPELSYRSACVHHCETVKGKMRENGGRVTRRGVGYLRALTGMEQAVGVAAIGNGSPDFELKPHPPLTSFAWALRYCQLLFHGLKMEYGLGSSLLVSIRAKEEEENEQKKDDKANEDLSEKDATESSSISSIDSDNDNSAPPASPTQPSTPPMQRQTRTMMRLKEIGGAKAKPSKTNMATKVFDPASAM